jgi:outer membrane lipoprotein-sorting protein
MIKHSFILLLIAGTFFGSSSFTEPPNPKPILDSLITKFNLVKDYSADVNINVNVSFIKIPVKQGKIYFKQPDKIKLESKGFAMIPKKGMGWGMQELFSKSYNAIFVKNEVVAKKNLSVIKVLPDDENSDIILATLWIDRRTYLMHKAEMVTRTSGKSIIQFNYPVLANPYNLPSSLVFTFDVNKSTLPIGITGEFDTEKKEKDDGKPKKAILTISYKNYLVNKGIADNFFVDKNQKAKQE